MISVLNVLIVCYYGAGFQFKPTQPVSVSGQFYSRLYYDGDATPRGKKICHHIYGPRADLIAGDMRSLDGDLVPLPRPDEDSLKSFSPSL